MTRAAWLLPILLAGCGYQTLHFAMEADGVSAAGTVREDGGTHAVRVVCDEAALPLKTRAIAWSYGGVLAPGPDPGTFRATGPGEGTITARFQAAGARELTGRVRVEAAPVVRMSPSPTPEPLPSATPGREPVALPTPSRVPEPEELIRQAYRQAGLGDFLEALELVRGIEERAWQPKVRALLAEWGERAVDQGLLRAQTLLEAGDSAQARRMLERIAPFPHRPTQRQAEANLRSRLGH